MKISMGKIQKSKPPNNANALGQEKAPLVPRYAFSCR